MAIFRPADILIPHNIDMTKWSVVACDQYTSEPEYWEDVKRKVGDEPSALNIIFPEIHLVGADDNARIDAINAAMERYLSGGIFREVKDAFVYVERKQANGAVRRGIVGMLDLEEYDYAKGSQTKIRATEGTIIERIPPRLKIRKNAPLEIPHIIILIDDREKTVIEPLAEHDFEKFYDFDLMKNSGHIAGYKVDKASEKHILDALDALDSGDLTFAVGDGNHSLAAAKAHWEKIKGGLSESERETHPARFALVEIENIHDEAIDFEPIQRVVFDTEPEKLLEALVHCYGASKTDNGGQRIGYVYKNGEGNIYVNKPSSNLPIGTLQNFLDRYLGDNGGRVDYIHGSGVVRTLAKRENTVGFLVDAMKKTELFETVIKDGSLPRKTFSMGEAHDKRFYLECKRIK